MSKKRNIMPVTEEEFSAMIMASAELGEPVCGVIPSGNIDWDKTGPKMKEFLAAYRMAKWAKVYETSPSPRSGRAGL